MWDGAVGSGTKVSWARWVSSTANASSAITCQCILSPTGAKTYSVGLSNLGGALATLGADATAPAYILVELI